jgi:hypothetical protein
VDFEVDLLILEVVMEDSVESNNNAQRTAIKGKTQSPNCAEREQLSTYGRGV